MGIAGAALATVVGQWSKVAVYFYLYLQPEYREQYQIAAGRRFDAGLTRRLLRYGAPSALQLFVGVGAFTVFLLLVGQLGREAMAATTLAFNIESVAFVPMIGVGMAVSTLVGQQLGADRPQLAARATWTSFVLAATYMGTFALLYLSIPDVFLLGHKAGADPAEFARIRDMTVVLLRFVAVYCLFDAMNIIFCSAIKGAGDTMFVLTVTILWSPLPVLAGWLGIHYFGWGLYWCWLVITVWICTLGLVYLSRFLHGKWRDMRVIEPDLIAEQEEAAVPTTELLPPGLPEAAVVPD
jgi:MATE family multidrug resistance protein